MTGGTAEAATINENLALAAERCGIALGVGSQRKALESPETAVSFEVRELAPNVPLLANLGAVQLNYGYGPDQCQQVVDMIEADALVLHLNPLQEAIQPEGDLRFAHLLPRIAEVVDRLTVPVVVKEIGCGISGKIARQLQAIGVEWIDTAGAGGTSWARIEAARADEPTLGELFSDWGIETPESIRQVRSVAGIRVIASGGVRNGIDVAKCLALGAELVGMAYPFLTAARISADEVERVVASMVRQLEIAMFCVGAKNRQALQQAPMTLDGRLLLSGR
jgi:isopentenyl-diphosphate delta-isomerase